MKNSRLLSAAFLLIIFTLTLNAQTFNPDTVQSKKFDTGKMWAFDYPPVEYLTETYGFTPSEEWLEDVRLSALRIGGCTSSFVSGSGLIMTNHHCSDGNARRVQKEGENLSETGFYAAALEEERQVPGMYADQLRFIKDVTEEIISAIDEGGSADEKAKLKEEKIKELEAAYGEDTGLRCQVVEYYNGGKYSLQGFKRYEDIRMVFYPHDQAAYFGGDYDNFTYPRYNLDCTFYRVYEDGKPLETEHFYKWSADGPKKDELIFVVGNPGTTNRLKTVAQLKYFRDVSYRNIAYMLDTYYNKLEEMKKHYTDEAEQLEEEKVRWGNGQKVYHNIYEGLTDPYLIARKQDWENKLIAKVKADPELNEKYGDVWESIKNTRAEMTAISPELSAYSMSPRFTAFHFNTARALVDYAKEISKPEEERSEQYKGENLDKTIAGLYPEDNNEPITLAKLYMNLGYLTLNLGADHELVKSFTGGAEGDEAAANAIAASKLNKKEDVMALVNAGADAILNSDDPFIQYTILAMEKAPELQKQAEEITNAEGVFENMLGQALFAVYGTSIPPDANRSLRLGDGVLKGFPYNGTITPVTTTFFGMYDRYYAFDKEYPWSLPEVWVNPPAEMDLSTDINFVSSHDIVGGSSGSAVINTDAEIVGLAFDGNINSIIGNFIYMPYNNRMVSVASTGMLEAMEHIYKALPLVQELKSGALPK